MTKITLSHFLVLYPFYDESKAMQDNLIPELTKIGSNKVCIIKTPRGVFSATEQPFFNYNKVERSDPSITIDYPLDFDFELMLNHFRLFIDEVDRNFSKFYVFAICYNEAVIEQFQFEEINNKNILKIIESAKKWKEEYHINGLYIDNNEIIIKCWVRRITDYTKFDERFL